MSGAAIPMAIGSGVEVRGPSAKCPKCGWDYYGPPKYECVRKAPRFQHSMRDDSIDEVERLRYTCQCGYSWTTPCLDTKPSS